ncbi:MAG: aldehyde-activating protein [Sphingomonadales bacterium 32-68-7]|nr:MAG: aldehyde-activating protein [Sphingomonadales bacterium 12-68-11]OYX09243.1 MAG: aldehyde-activating protein [Sphingomonadales bacterium 32-68-7]
MVSSKTTRTGGCHCGAVRFEAEVPEPLVGGRCNCSICAIKGVVMVNVPLADLRITQGQDALATYTFNTGVAKHHFCPTCGIHVFHQARSDPGKFGINAAALDGVCPYADFPDVNVNDGTRHVRDTGVSRSAGRLRFEPNRT